MSPSASNRVKSQRVVLTAVLLLLATNAWLHAAAQSQNPTAREATRGTQQQLVQPSTTLVQRLRRLLNLSPPLAVGGSRSGSGQRVCLISPWPTTPPQGQMPALALVPATTPLLLAVGPLNEIQILRRDRIVWRQRASSTSPIVGPIPWPLEPLQPSEQALVRLRPAGAAGADFAEIQLEVPSAQSMQNYQQLLGELLVDPSRWPAAIEAELSRNPELAVALASDPRAPAAIQRIWQESTVDGVCQ